MNNPLRYVDPSGYKKAPVKEDAFIMDYANYWNRRMLHGGGGGGFGGPGYGRNGTGLNGVYYDWYSDSYRSTNIGNSEVGWGHAYNNSILPNGTVYRYGIVGGDGVGGGSWGDNYGNMVYRYGWYDASGRNNTKPQSGGGSPWYYGIPGVGPSLESGDNLARGNYFAAIAAFGMALVDVITFGSGSAYTSAAKTGTRVFFSGAGAEAKAISKGFTNTIGQTRAGQNLAKLTANMPYYPGSKAYEMWGRLSTQWAKGVSGEVHVFQNATNGVDVLSIWKVYEYPALKSNPNVTNIIFHY